MPFSPSDAVASPPVVESLAPPELGAMALALAGVTWVVLERGRGSPQAPREAHGSGYGRGIMFGIGSAICQAVGLVLSKPGLANGFPALSATMIRMFTGMVAMWLIAAATGTAGQTIRRVRADRRAAQAILVGSFVGPFLGVWLSLVAVQAARVGIASTLIAMTPVISPAWSDPLLFSIMVGVLMWRPHGLFGRLGHG